MTGAVLGYPEAVEQIDTGAPAPGRVHWRRRKNTLNRIGLEDMILEAFSGWFATWWWLIPLAVALVVLRGFASGGRSRRHRNKGNSRRPDRGRRRAAAREPVLARPMPSRRLEGAGRTITGKAYVTDGDGVRVAGEEVRLAGLDAPEWDQKAKHRDGYWFNHGKRVKSALIRELGGKHVSVFVEGTDKFGRLLGTVTREGRDIGEWLVREGHAIAAYDDRYKRIERGARRARRGMWAHAHNFDPRAHRHRKP